LTARAAGESGHEENPMRITTITIARLVNTGNYENTRVELTAELGEADSLFDAAQVLSVSIAHLLRVERKRRDPDAPADGYPIWLTEDAGVSG
jgi:hypothetical protein